MYKCYCGIMWIISSKLIHNERVEDLITDNNSFEDIESFIEYLKENGEIIGIVEYGGRTYREMSLGEDYDLTAIFDKPVSKNFIGVHFHIKDIPIDCMIMSFIQNKITKIQGVIT